MSKNLLLLLTLVFAGLNLPSVASEVTYQYDPLNRLTLVKYDDSNMIHYTYDAAGNRTKMIRIGPDNFDLDSDNDGAADRLELLVFGNLERDSSADLDADGLPDLWEAANLGTADYDGSPDPDGDGWSNLQEYERDTDPARYVLELHPGWNLVSIALAPSDYSVDGIFGDSIDKPAWYWDDAYRAADNVLPLAGHWVYCDNAQSVEINLGSMPFPDDPDTDGDGLADSVEQDIGTDPGKYVITLQPGWNLISICRVPPDNTPEAIFGDAIILPAWKWENDRYKTAAQIKPLLGYWVYHPGTESVTIELQLPQRSR